MACRSTEGIDTPFVAIYAYTVELTAGPNA